MKEERIYAALVAAGFIRNQKGEVLLVDKRDLLTLPTGHMDPSDVELKETVIREMGEELGLEDLIIVESLGTMVRNKSSPNAKVIEIFSCKALEKAVKYYNEGEKKVWMRPSQTLVLTNLLDELAREAVKRFLEKHPGPAKKEEGDNDEKTRRNFGKGTNNISKDCLAAC